MRDARVPVLVAACLLPLAVHAAGKPAEGPQSAVEFFQQLFGDAPHEPTRPVVPSTGPDEPDAARDATPGEAAEAPEPAREPVPFDAEEEADEGSEEDVPAVNPAFRGRFGDAAEPPFPAPSRPVVSDTAPPPTAPAVRSSPVVSSDAVAPSKPIAAPRVPVVAPPTVATPVRPAFSPADPRPSVAPLPAATRSPVPAPSRPAGDTYVDEDDLMEDEATLEIEEISED